MRENAKTPSLSAARRAAEREGKTLGLPAPGLKAGAIDNLLNDKLRVHSEDKNAVHDGSVCQHQGMEARTERFAHSRFAHSAGERSVLCVVLRFAPCSKTRRALVPDVNAGNHDRPACSSVQTCRDVGEQENSVQLTTVLWGIPARERAL